MKSYQKGVFYLVYGR